MSGRRFKKKLLKLGVALIILGLTLYLQKHPQTANPTLDKSNLLGYEVTEFVDGDTLEVNLDGVKEKVRLIGVDTPETKDPRVEVQCFGLAASKFTKDLIGQNRVRLEADPLNTNRDRYNRLLRYVYLPDGRLVNAEIIKEGFGFAYLNFPFTKSDEFHGYEVAAREAGKGLWSNCSTTDVNGREQSNPL